MTIEKTRKLLDFLPRFLLKEESSNNYKLMLSLSNEYVDIDTNVIELKRAIQISTASGSYLEDIADLFGLKREDSETDTEFRARIQGFFTKNVGGGVESSLKSSLALGLGISESIITIETVTRNIFIITFMLNGSENLESFNSINNIITENKAAGMYLKQIYFNSNNDLFLVNLSEANGEDKV